MNYLIMTKCDTKIYPKYVLPEGYYFKMYSKGDEKYWVDIEMSVSQFDKQEDGLVMFNCEFVKNHDLPLDKRIVFVFDCNGNCVATGALWNGLFNGKIEQRLHWIAVDESCKGKGIAKALVTKLLDIYNELGYNGFLYLITETWCYSAVNIYDKFGFKPYVANNPVVELGLSDKEFIEKTKIGWEKVNEKLKLYNK